MRKKDLRVATEEAGFRGPLRGKGAPCPETTWVFEDEALALATQQTSFPFARRVSGTLREEDAPSPETTYFFEENVPLLTTQQTRILNSPKRSPSLPRLPATLRKKRSPGPERRCFYQDKALLLATQQTCFPHFPKNSLNPSGERCSTPGENKLR